MPNRVYSAEDILGMDKKAQAEILFRGTPLNLEAITDSSYLGIDLSLPGWMNKLLWKKFRKTLYRDPERGVIRGWNVRLVKNGLDGPSIPMKNSRGEEVAFGHFVVRDAEGVRFPGGWKGGNYLDFIAAGNSQFDPGQFGFCPMTAVNEGSVDLILGWEVLKFGSVFIPLPDYWLLRREGPLETVVPIPRPARLLK